MNNQLSSSKGGEYSSNQGIAKSQKVLNSVANLHVRTQVVERGEEQGRSPQGRGELRETWRRPRMPYNKLPDAFQIKQKKKKNEQEVADNLDRMVKYNEYKEIQKYLEPIQPADRPLDRPPDRPFLHSPNPLATYQKYLKIKTKFSEQLQDRDLSINKYKALSTKQPQGLRIPDCITLELLKRGHHTGTVKKMLHVPTLRLVCVREEPLNSKECRHAIKEWLMLWQARLADDRRFAALHSTAYNYPEGAVSIVTEYFKQGSLLDLLNVAITLPESVIQQVFAEVAEHLEYYYEQTETHFGGLSPSQVLITTEGRVKLGLGLFYPLAVGPSSIYHLRAPRPHPEFNATHKNFMKTTLDRPVNTELEKSLDVFKLGLMMLESAIGGFDNFEQSAVLLESVRGVLGEEGQRAVERENVCCLIHSEVYLLENAAQGDQRSRRDRLDISRTILYSKFLKDRFSPPFLSLLCHCLRLSHARRATFRDFAQHSFLRNDPSKDAKTVTISLLDLLQVSSEWNQDFGESVQQERVDKFIGHVLHVLNGCRREVIQELIEKEKEKILDLPRYIGLNYVGLGQKLYQAMLEMARTDKRDFPNSQ